MQSSNDLHIVILAAGKGTRMYSKQPKVLHKIAGKSLLAHAIETAEKLEPKSITVVVGHGKEQVIANTPHQVNWVEQTEQLGTGHALKMALPHLPKQGRTLVLYGDVPLIDVKTLQELIDTPKTDDVSLLTDIIEDASGYGRIIRDENHQIIGIVEEKDTNDEQKKIQEFNTGLLSLPNQFIESWLNALQNNNQQGEYYLTDVIALAVKEGKAICGIQVAKHHLAAGINNKVQLAELERIYQHEQAVELLKAGVTLLDPSRLDLRGCLKHGQDVVIDANVIIEGDCTLGNDVQIGSNVVLKNVKIADGVQIAPFSHLENCEIGKESTIGPFARLRPNAKLGEKVHIGNFVEVKNTTIGNGSKANHLTYLGDAQIGTQTNIGAGSITCNYDGVNKFKTTIGDNVRIGSGTMMVAPLTIEDLATTGAGSVITKTCPQNQLTIGRSRQVSLANWKRPEKSDKKS